MAEPILKVDCDSCKSVNPEHAFSKNVKGDFG